MTITAFLPQFAHAACASPAGKAGQQLYAENLGLMVFCNGSAWVSMGGAVADTQQIPTLLNDFTDVDTSGVGSGDFLKYDGANWVPASPFGTLTNTKWCTSDGSTVNCTSDAPTLSESDPQVGALTTNNFCQANGDGSAIVCGNDAPTQRTALGLGTMAIQNADAVAISGGSLTGLTSLSVAGIITATYFEGDGSRLTGISGGGTAAGTTGDIQFNSSNAFAADTGVFTYASGLLSAPTVSATTHYFGDSAAYLINDFTNPSLVFDTNDYLRFNRSQNRFGLLVGGFEQLRANADGVSVTSLAVAYDITATGTVSSSAVVAGTGTFTGPVTGITPTADAHLATKAYVDAAVASGGGGGGLGAFSLKMYDKNDALMGYVVPVATAISPAYIVPVTPSIVGGVPGQKALSTYFRTEQSGTANAHVGFTTANCTGTPYGSVGLGSPSGSRVYTCTGAATCTSSVGIVSSASAGSLSINSYRTWNGTPGQCISAAAGTLAMLHLEDYSSATECYNAGLSGDDDYLCTFSYE